MQIFMWLVLLKEEFWRDTTHLVVCILGKQNKINILFQFEPLTFTPKNWNNVSLSQGQKKYQICILGHSIVVHVSSFFKF